MMPLIPPTMGREAPTPHLAASAMSIWAALVRFQEAANHGAWCRCAIILMRCIAIPSRFLKPPVAGLTGRLWREELPPGPRLAASMEALGVTTRLLAVMNWLLRPDHNGEVTVLGPIDCPELPPLPADHPLLATDGGPIALASRKVLARAHQLAALNGETP